MVTEVKELLNETEAFVMDRKKGVAKQVGITIEGVEKDLRGAFSKINKRWGADIRGVVMSRSKVGRSSEEGEGPWLEENRARDKTIRGGLISP
ncbi:hypothetical protein Taro_015296 [Colocasia esculenta]|uniref:Uncharacterized protein n=1 Tax=Colocasia esculenta TaxID=4460 RepID=A0A843USQ9_COLES|nr:hypothetical protein [Colocasia esculenta]